MQKSMPQQTVAVVGSGMAGLVTAFLLHRDPERKYRVEVFETGPEPSLDSASVSVHQPDQGREERIDVPMRAFSGGYYPNLKAMYDYLRIGYRRQRILFSFSADGTQDQPVSSNLKHLKTSSPGTYFIHASNGHVFPPLRPVGVPLSTYLIELVFVGLCTVWFAVCCYLVEPRENEALADYFDKVHLPERFSRLYILPLLSAICTCSHHELLRFPAADVVNYRRRIFGGEQFVVTNGVREVQRKLLENLEVTFSALVTSVSSDLAQVSLTWQDTRSSEKESSHSKQFDHVVFAVSPNSVAKIFKPASSLMAQFPTASVETVVHSDHAWMERRLQHAQEESLDKLQRIARAGSAQVIHLHTRLQPDPMTEASHIHDSGTTVTTSPVTSIDKAKVHGCHHFTRVLRTVESRQLTNSILGTPTRHATTPMKWRNGDMGVWVVGAWSWDGMVLLEGCVASAMRVARALNVQVPWM